MSSNGRDWSAILAQFNAELPVRSEVSLENAPAPARLATNTSALLADVEVLGEAVGDGRLVLLHEPEYQESWDGSVRLVGFVRADLEEELVTDSLLLEVGWSWVTDSFSEMDLHPLVLSGTVSRTGNQSFGDISSRPPTGAIEIRSSWTVPDGESVAEHAMAWVNLLTQACGIEPLPDGVATFKRVARK